MESATAAKGTEQTDGWNATLDQMFPALSEPCPTSHRARLERTGRVYSMFDTKGGRELMRRFPTLSVVVGNQIQRLLPMITDIAVNNPELIIECAKAKRLLTTVQNSNKGLLSGRYEFRKAIRPPRRYDDEY